MPTRSTLALAAIAACLALTASARGDSHEGAWIPLFTDGELHGLTLPENGPWAIEDGVIDCDPARSPGVGGDIWSEEEFGDFILHLEWRFTDTPTEDTFPVVLPDGSHKTDADGNVVTQTFPNGDSGIFLRGQPKAQINIWNWPIGSGEVYGYRTDGSMPPEVRRGVTPLKRADNPIGEWNTFIISMIGDRLSVILNGQLVIDHAQLPGVAESGPIALQFHGGYNEETGEYGGASSLVQFRNIHVKQLD